MSLYSLFVDGFHVASQIAGHTPPTWETLADGGCGELSTVLDVRPGHVHYALRPGAKVALRFGAHAVYAGFLRDYNSETGELAASGMGSRSKMAIDPTGIPTLDVGVAITQAIARGWQVTNPSGISGSVAGTATEVKTVGELLSTFALETAQRWGVDGRRCIYLRTDPTSPTWRLAPGVAALGQTGEGSARALVGTYFDGTVTQALVVGDLDGDEDTVDLTDRGTLGVMQATAILNGTLAQTAGHVAWVNGVTVTRDQLTTIGGTPAALASVTAGQMMRLTGLPVLAAGALWVDVVIGRTRHTAGSDVIYLEPVNTAPRNLTDVLAAT